MLTNHIASGRISSGQLSLKHLALGAFNMCRTQLHFKTIKEFYQGGFHLYYIKDSVESKIINNY